MIIRKSPAEIEIMARSGKIIADMLELVAEAVRPGVSTGELDRMAEDGSAQLLEAESAPSN